jgi:hypothetical protein
VPAAGSSGAAQPREPASACFAYFATLKTFNSVT